MQFRFIRSATRASGFTSTTEMGFSIDRHQKADNAGFTIMIFGTFCILMAFSSLNRGGGEFYLPILISFLAIPYLDKAKMSPESQCDNFKKGEF